MHNFVFLWSAAAAAVADLHANGIDRAIVGLQLGVTNGSRRRLVLLLRNDARLSLIFYHNTSSLKNFGASLTPKSQIIGNKKLIRR